MLRPVRLSLSARGEIQLDGSFELTTFKPGDGAVAGKHNCVVLQRVIGENIVGHKPSVIGVVDPKYASYQTSGLEVEISAEQENNVAIVVTGVQKQPAAGEEHEHHH